MQVPPELPGKRRKAALLDEEGPIEPTASEDSGATLLQGFFLQFVTCNFYIVTHCTYLYCNILDSSALKVTYYC